MIPPIYDVFFKLPNGYFVDSSMFSNPCAAFGYPTPNTLGGLNIPCYSTLFVTVTETGDYNISVDLTDNNDIVITYTAV